ncbi:LuxR C-terminal-related transcriptional regulator [Anaerobacterium chartisolvens]|uniref:LuxR C-terminal-related transcriptional regulator n=1 Tax=Anaerobacterium chartisolvens TaxID=1297424 RepID=UPI001474E122|nr:LuxR C-terminal-related transcriptional regulator [Anaerobacterium chartisolvens]
MPVTVIEAPSGYGKTTAVQDYLKNTLPKGVPVHWWNAEEDAPTAYWTALCKEFMSIDPMVGKELLSLGFPKPMSAWEIGKLIGSLSCDAQTVLVLDDFHFLQKVLSRNVMSALLSYAGKKLHLVIITQTVRPFPLSYFEQKDIHYIRTEDLRLNSEDIRQYCRLCGISVSKEEAGKIYEYTEGWIAAVYLTVLQMQRDEGIVPGLSLIQLMENIVWKNMSAQGKNLFFHISLFPSVSIEHICFLLQTVPLPEAVFTLLEETPFVRYEAEKHQYVPHAVLREMLLRRLKAADIQTRNRCYGRAGAWFAKTGDILYALECFYKICDYEAIFSLPLTGMTLARIGGIPFTQMAERLIWDCPTAIKQKYPIALLRIAYAFISANSREQAVMLLEEIKGYIGRMEKSDDQKALLGEWILISAFLHFPDIQKMEPAIREAAEQIGGRCRTLTAEEPFAFGLPLMIFFHRTPGKLDEEMQALSSVIQRLSVLTGVKIGADVLFQAESALFRGNFSKAERLSYKAAYIAEGSRQWTVRMGTVNLMAQLAMKRGNNSDLSQYMNELEKSVDKEDAICPFVAQMLQTDYYMWLGLTELIPQSVRRGRSEFVDAPSWVRVYLGYFHIGILLQEADYNRLLGTAEAAIMECREEGYLMVEIYMCLIAAMGYYQTEHREKAFSYVKEALDKSKPDGIYLPFMEFKSVLGGLVEKAFYEQNEKMPEEIAESGQIIGDNWKLLIRLSSESNVLPYGLTEREMEVATLAAKGMSNKEISSVLYITEATVKFHLRTVFSKLGIDRRSKLSRLLE